jgi:glycosidase
MKIYLAEFGPYGQMQSQIAHCRELDNSGNNCLPRSYSPLFEFHINLTARMRYKIEDALFMLSGNVIIPDFRTVRILADRMNEIRRQSDNKIRPGDLNAMGLIDEIYHYVLRLYEETANPKVFYRAIHTLNSIPGTIHTDKCLRLFGEFFPPLDVYKNRLTFDQYLQQSEGSKPNIEIALEELILLYFANFNPAFAPFRELFDDTVIADKTRYGKIIEVLESFFAKEKPFGPDNQHIFDLLKGPILASPHDLAGQLAYIRKRWGLILSEKFLKKILSADDLIKEDFRIITPGSAGSPPVPLYGAMKVSDLDLERFTNDVDWMPNVVLIAKNVYVWMHQLSVRYQRAITKLHEIPDEELDQLARWNINALWLIGVWERCSASQRIKQWTGNPEAAASAYSLFDYVIANDIGGEESFQNLRYRAWQRGIRLASDMVPNHMGIFSKWVIEHPEYFIQSHYPPFPNYGFTGGNLSEHPGIDIRIEDGYWSRRDAAVVFQRTDTGTGETRYIYHGNDGTHMPWNDTAQLNFLRPDVREAVIQTIMHVARKFPIIRFDAAMTLTKRHYQRLWFPAPGSGGDIPSRADYALSTEEFNANMPNEFWREVVDRINNEIPNTLLLAEAFWLLEGYFVRTLGMHRVYNSAFMHMFMREENSKYRELIRNTLHYNPEILKRYVNFMSNPDEETAVAQFGKDDKYFGVAIMMVTLPGLPMFAHGQVEGYSEKYGMEYKRAYHDETPDMHLVHRHEAEIFPLLQRRYLFSQVNNFELYNLIDQHGNVNEDVIAFSNMHSGERALICFHNKYKETSGWIKHTVGRNVGSTEHPHIIYKSLGQGLELSLAPNVYYTFKDQKRNLEYIRSAQELHEKGLFLELKAFSYHVFVDFKEITDTSGDYEKLRRHLHGKGTPDLQEELHMVRIFPILLKLSELISKNTIKVFNDVIHTPQTDNMDEALKPIINRYESFARALISYFNEPSDTSPHVAKLKYEIKMIKSALSTLDIEKRSMVDFSMANNMLILYVHTVIRSYEQSSNKKLYNILRLGKSIEELTVALAMDDQLVENSNSALRLFLSEELPSDPGLFISGKVNRIFDIPEVQEFIRCNQHEGIQYYRKERMEELLLWLYTFFVLSDQSKTGNEKADTLLKKILGASDQSRYRLNDFRKKLIQMEEKYNA